jgi:bacterial leucyl aminopeptidase
MSSNNIRRTVIFTIFVCLAAFAAIGGTNTSARTAEDWVSVNWLELDAVAGSVSKSDDGKAINERVDRVVDGIAILKLNDAQMEELSRAMHEMFHKCGGFVRHASEAEAVAWVENLRSVDPDAPTVDYTIDNPATAPLVAAAGELETRQVIIDLSAFPNRRYNQPSGLESANWIKNRWTQFSNARGNITSVEFFNHPANVSPQPSVVMTIRGSRFPDEVVVLGAHQDSINLGGQTQPAPGADDDASGVACLTEIIRVLTAKVFRPERTVKFMAYAAEEVGLRGSDAIAASYRAANTNVVGVLQLDMTNYRGSQGFDMVMITDFTNAAQNQFVRDLITTYQPGLLVTNSACGYACSDHASWNNRSYPASFPFEAPFGNDNPFIHTANDTLAQSNNNANHAHRFTKLGISYVTELAKGCISPRTPCPIAGGKEPIPTLELTHSKTVSGSLLLDASSF